MNDIARRSLPGLMCAALALLPRESISSPWPAGAGTDIGGGLASGYEASGIVWHPRLGQLFVVSDSGIVSAMDPDGTVTDNWPVGGDLEGIAIADPSTNLLYLGIESDGGRVYTREFNLSTGALTGKSWRLTAMEGYGNSQLEALTFVPNGEHPYTASTSGGLFYAGLQSDGRIFVYDITTAVNGSVSLVATIAAAHTYISDMYYSSQTRTLYAIYDPWCYLREMTTDGTLIAEYTLPGNDQEGLTVIPSNSGTSADVCIAEDDQGVTHELWRYSGYPVLDTDGDGLSDAAEIWHDGSPGYNTSTDTLKDDPNTDDDAWSDGIEVASGSNPRSAGSTPSTVRINFQTATASIPSGYCAESGLAYSSAKGFGWR